MKHLLILSLLVLSACVPNGPTEVPIRPSETVVPTATELVIEPTLLPTMTLTCTASPTITLTPVPTATPPEPVAFRWKRVLPCDAEAPKYIQPGDLETLKQRLIFWRGWIAQYGNGLPEVLALSVIAHESRGLPSARGCAGEVGLFQIVPKDPKNVIRPIGCTNADLPNFPENPSARQARNSMFNIDWGTKHLRDMAWYATMAWLGNSMDKIGPAYEKFLAGNIWTDMAFWESDVGRQALGMNQCGQYGYFFSDCGTYGGDQYAEDILGCWVPWIQDNVLE